MLIEKKLKLLARVFLCLVPFCHVQAQAKHGLHVNTSEHVVPLVYKQGEALKPTVLSTENSYTVEKDTSLTLNCPSPAGRKVDVFLWHKHKSYPTYQISPSDDHILRSGNTFQILKATSTDSGVYFCYAVEVDNKHKVHKWRVADVNVVSEIPKFVPTASTPTPRYAPTLNEVLEESEPLIYFNLQSPVCLPVTLSDTLTLKPTVLGRQPVVLNWFKDSEVVTQSARLRVSGSNDQQLELYPPFGTDDSGSYEIKACNSMGCKSRGVQLFFYSVQNEAAANAAVTEEGETPAIVGGMVSGILCYCLVMFLLRRKGIICRDIGKEVEETSREIVEQMNRGMDSKSSFLWSWDEQSKEGRLAESDKKDTTKKDRIVTSIKSGVGKMASSITKKEMRKSDKIKKSNVRSAPALPIGPRPRPTPASRSTPTGIPQTYGGAPEADIYGNFMPGGAGDIYETYGQFPRLAIGGGAGDIYGTVGPMIQPQMGGAMDIYGRYGTAVSGYQPYGNYGMHGGYGYGTTDENIYGEAPMMYGPAVQGPRAPLPAGYASAIYGPTVASPPVPPPIGYGAPQVPHHTPAEPHGVETRAPGVPPPDTSQAQ